LADGDGFAIPLRCDAEELRWRAQRGDAARAEAGVERTRISRARDARG